MKLFVQGRKGGQNTLFPENTPNEFFQLAGDIQHESPSNASYYYGKTLYSIALAKDGPIFTKIIIGYDKNRGHLGNIGISVLIPKNKKLEGANIKKLLDRLMDLYVKEYIPEFIINIGTRENWTLFTSKVDSYKIKLKSVSDDDIEHLVSQRNHPAYIFYSSDNQLEQYFNDPYQEEYTPYKQVFFIDRNLEEKPENPLNAIRHDKSANLTGKIDLDNPKYRLIYNHNTKGGVKIEVRVNGKIRSNKSKFRRKDNLQITWSKPYYKTELQEGRLSEISSKFIEIDDENKKLEIKELSLEEEKKTIYFELKDYKGNPINDVEIQIGNRPWQKNLECTFSAEEIGKIQTITARKGDFNHKKDICWKGEKKFIPEDVGEKVELTLNRFKEITLEIRDQNNKLIKNARLVSLRSSNKIIINNLTVQIIDDEIEKDWEFSVEANGYESKGDTLDPSETEPIILIKLKKTIVKKYDIDPGKYGKKKEGCPDYVHSSIGQGISSKYIEVTNKKFKFDKWKLEDGKLIAQYKEREYFYTNPKFIAAAVISALIIVIGVMSFNHFWGKDYLRLKRINENMIISYIEGDSIFTEILEEYDSIWNKKKPKIKATKPCILAKFGIGSEKEKSDSTKYKDWEKTSHLITNTKELRHLIDDMGFLELKEFNFEYSENQQAFKNAITLIDSNNISKIREEMKRDISNLTLTQIADSINIVISNMKEGQEQQIEDDNDNMSAVVEINSSSNTNPEQNNSNSTANASSQNSSTKAANSNIKDELKSSSITKEKLKEYKDANFSSDFNKSIELYLEFWKKVEQANIQKDDFKNLLKRVEKDKYLKSSELKIFLDEICISDNFSKFETTRGRSKSKSISELNEKYNESNKN